MTAIPYATNGTIPFKKVSPLLYPVSNTSYCTAIALRSSLDNFTVLGIPVVPPVCTNTAKVSFLYPGYIEYLYIGVFNISFQDIYLFFFLILSITL